MIEKLQNLDWGLMITILSFLFAVYVAIKAKKKKQIAFSISNYNIVEGNGIEELEINFKGEKIKKATITKLAIWNCGNVTINREDIVSTKPLSIQCSGKILNAQIIKATDESNLVNILRNNRNITLDFEYLEPKDGVIVQIIHDSEKNDVELQGKIKGKLPIKNINQMPKLFKKINVSRRKRRLYEKISMIIMCVLLVLEVTIFDLVEVGITSTKSYETINVTDNTIVSKVVLILLSVITVLLVISMIKKLFLINVPSKLREYNEYNEYDDDDDDDEKINNISYIIKK